MTVRGVSRSMRWALPLTVAFALLVGLEAPSGQATSSVPTTTAKSAFPPMLGMSFGRERGMLAWFDPLTLQPLRGRKAPLGVHGGDWAFSSDRSVLAVGRCNPPEIRFVDARAMRVLGDLRISPYPGCANRSTWLRPDRLLATVSLGRQSELVVVDPVERRVVRREPFQPVAVWDSGHTRDELVLLLAGDGTVAPARLAVIDAEGTIRTVGIDRILAGSVVDEASEQPHARIVSPGLAIDPDGRRAFVVPASGPVAEVDLQTLEVSYHELDPPSLLGRFLRWLQPSAQAKGLTEGPTRQAQWLGNGLIAVSGADHSFVRSANGEEEDTSTPAGLRLIDTRTWTTRMLDRGVSWFAATPQLVVGSRVDRGEGSVIDLLAFGRDGQERWRLHNDHNSYATFTGPVGYVYSKGAQTAKVVDLATGKVLRTLSRNGSGSWPQLLAAQSSS